MHDRPKTSGEGAPLVSIITPSMNQAGFIREALESVAAQEYRPIEHIVVDGGSTDGSQAIIAELAEAHPSLRWVSEPDGGQSDAVNKGFRMARGEILGWLNSDDFYCPGAIRSAVEALASDETLLGVYGDAWLVNRAGRPRYLFPWTEEFNAERLRRVRNYIVQPATFVRRRAIDLVGPLDTSLHWTMDWDLWIRISQAGLMRRIDQPLACVREYESTKSGSGGLARYREIVRLLRRHGVGWLAPAYRFYLLGVTLEALRWRVKRLPWAPLPPLIPP